MTNFSQVDTPDHIRLFHSAGGYWTDDGSCSHCLTPSAVAIVPCTMKSLFSRDTTISRLLTLEIRMDLYSVFSSRVWLLFYHVEEVTRLVILHKPMYRAHHLSAGFYNSHVRSGRFFFSKLPWPVSFVPKMLPLVPAFQGHGGRRGRPWGTIKHGRSVWERPLPPAFFYGFRACSAYDLGSRHSLLLFTSRCHFSLLDCKEW